MIQYKQTGFTLIEIIITITIISILGTMIYSYFDTSMNQGTVQIIQLQKSLKLHTVMEKITADYNDLLKIDASVALNTLKDRINKYDLTDPPPDLNDFWERVYYGKYGIEYNDFIKFVVNGDDILKEEPILAGDIENILKVTIKNEFGETLTALFTLP